MEYLVVVHTAEEGGYCAEVPSLPGCFAQGESLDEVLAETRDAIVSHLEALREDGQPIPREPVMIAAVSAPEPMETSARQSA